MPPSPAELWQVARDAIGSDGVLFLERFGSNRYSASIAYDTTHGRAALTLFSGRPRLRRRDLADSLHVGVARLQELATKTARRGK
jgi:hypothetical protein